MEEHEIMSLRSLDYVDRTGFSVLIVRTISPKLRYRQTGNLDISTKYNRYEMMVD